MSIGILESFYKDDLYNIAGTKSYYSYKDYKRFVVGNVLNFFDIYSKGFDYNNKTLEEIDEKFLEIYTELNNDKKLTSEHVYPYRLFSSLYYFSQYTVCEIDENLLETLTNTVLPKTYKISNFILPGLVLLFPSNNEIKTFSITFEASEIDLSISHIELENPNDFNSARSRSLEISIGETTKLTHETYNTPMIPPPWKFLLNFLLWQQSIKDRDDDVILITEPKIITKGFGEKAKKTIFPRRIGEGYKPKIIREYESEKGTHASPRTHWRSGHWRNQQFGSRKKPEYKTKWIEPILING